MLNAPVPLLYERGPVAESDVLEILLLKVLQSVLERRPRLVADDVGRLKVTMLPEAVMVKSEPAVEVAKVTVPVCV